MFVNRHEQADIVKDCERFLKTIEELKFYIGEFNEDGIMKDKKYLFDCIVGERIWQPIIVIICYKYMFSANDSICKAWTQVKNTFLRPKKHGQRIIVSEFLLLFGQLNLFSLFEEK